MTAMTTSTVADTLLVTDEWDDTSHDPNSHALTSEESQALLDWFINGEVGQSSTAIVANLTGMGRNDRRPSHPRDGDDFRRCLILVDRIPSFRERLPQMALVSPPWAVIVAEWDTLAELLMSENGTWRERYEPCPKTTARMKVLLDGYQSWLKPRS